MRGLSHADPKYKSAPQQDAFIDEVIESGEYQNASEAMRDAVRALQQRRSEDALKLERLRKAIKAGADALDRGDYTEVADEDLDDYLDSLVENSAEASGR